MSRYSEPGSILPAWDESGHGLAVVVATSRHKRKLSTGDAVALLAVEAVHYCGGASLAPEDREKAVEVAARMVREQGVTRWRSVTQREVDEDVHGFGHDAPCEPGRWCADGSGAAWMDVLSVNTGAVEDAVNRDVLGEAKP